MENAQESIKKALEIIAECGSIDGAHHKQWVLDQVVRQLTGDKYQDWCSQFDEVDENGEQIYFPWDQGIAP